MRVRFYSPQDYPMLCKWWEHYKFPPPPIEFLPQTGVIVDDTCAAFIYKTDSALFWVEWIIANKEKSKEERSKAIDYILETVKILASLQGANAMFTSTNLDSLKEKLQKNGFNKTDDSVSHFIWR